MRPPWSFNDPDGLIHVVGPADLPSVLEALQYRAERLGSPAPTELTEDDVEQVWMRRVIDDRGDNLVPCSPDDVGAVLVTRWTGGPGH